MSYITSLPDRLCEWFSDMYEFSDCSFCTQFPSQVKETPLIKPVVVFGLNGIETQSDEIVLPESESRKVNEEFSVGIYVPLNKGGAYCNYILSRIADQLLFNTSLEIRKITATETVYVRNPDSLFMSLIFTVTETLYKGTDYPEPFVFE